MEKPRIERFRTALPAMAIIALLPLRAAANPFEFFGFSSRDQAMARAVTAAADAYTGIYYNQACLPMAGDITFGGGYFQADPDLRIDGADTDVDNISGLPLGFSLPIKVIKGLNLAAGAAFQIPNKRVARYLLIPYERPRFTLYANRMQRILAFIAVGVEVGPWLSVGGGVSVLAALGGGPNLYLQEAHTGYPSIGTLDSNIRPSFAPYMGVLVTITEGLRVGLTYRRKLSSRLDVPASVTMPDIHIAPWNPLALIQETLIEAGGLQVSHFTPSNLAVGVAWQAHERVLVTADLTWLEWSDFRYYTPEVVLELTGPPGSLDDWIEITEQDVPLPGFRDVFMPAFGAEILTLSTAHVDLFVRCGYFYRPTPVPDQPGETNFVDSDLHAGCFGLGVVLRDFTNILSKPLHLDLHIQYQMLEERRFEKERLPDPIGDYETDGEILNVGASMMIRF